jgi:peptidoglycan/xylan/chitin deacetylase (PgdA/CDA1 family)
MVPIIKRLGFAAISGLSLDWLKKRSPIDVISPFHHLVADERVPYVEKLYAFKNAKQFEADLDYLLKHFRTVTLQEAIQQQEPNRPPRIADKSRKPAFLICFDDGLRQVYETAVPILLRKGVPAALFINPAFVGNKEIFYNFKKGWILHKLDDMDPGNAALNAAGDLFGRKIDTHAELVTAIRSINYLNRDLTDQVGRLFGIDLEDFRKKQRPFMTAAEIKELAAKGFGIGSHSIDHPLYSLVSPEEQLRQTRISTDWVVKEFNLPYKAFAFPHVDTGVGMNFFHELLDSKNPELDLIFGNSTGMLEDHPRVLHRFIGENPAIPLDRMIKSVLAYSAVRKIVGRSFVQRS